MGQKVEPELLKDLYSKLDYISGNLVDISSTPESWLEVGDWLETAKNISGVSKVFFVNNNPIILFAFTQNREKVKDIFNDSWCMMRPKLLYVATPGELTLLDLSKNPVKNSEELMDRKILEQVKTTSEILEQWKDYSREKIESYDFEINKFSGGAESQFIQDLNFIRNSLTKNGLNKEKVRYAHAIIGRSIFIKYLEDREILTEDYFLKIANKNTEWKKLLYSELEKPSVFANSICYYSKVLKNKEFTYCLFAQLKEDFNGDVFSSIDSEDDLYTLEQKYIKQEHLNLLSHFLLGDSNKENLFFWAYNFKIIPIEIISSIYEEFYHEENIQYNFIAKKKTSIDTKGTNYTPSTLVEFLILDTLTQDILSKNPKILDPACGSGIFLVEAFKRIIRYKSLQKSKKLTLEELSLILKEQIFGIEINPEAIKIASFSLYLALLNHLEPKDILENISSKKRLPRLIFSKGDGKEGNFNTLVNHDTFRIEELFSLEEISSNFKPQSFDIVLGNPPWGSKLDTKSKQTIQNWCDTHQFPIGDKEPSQAFIGISLYFLKEGSIAGLLVSSGIFFKHGLSKEFRNYWLSQVQLKKVVNFDHVRNVFFSGGRKNDSISPFASIIFQKLKLEYSNLFEYWTAKKISSINSSKIVILHKTDLKIVRQEDIMKNHKLWKIYWWGGHRDRNLIDYLENNFDRLEKYIGKNIGQGLKENDKHSAKVDFNFNLPILESEKFKRYSKLKQSNLTEHPKKVCQLGQTEMYFGDRILLSRGIKQEGRKKGVITARFEENDFCFRHSINGLKLISPSKEKYKILLGILWSSLARYYWFQTSSQWGQWHNAIHIIEIINLPIRFPDNKNLEKRIIQIVDQLRNIGADESISDGLFSNKIFQLESDLDETIFELYNLNHNEIDLIKETCELKLDLLYKGVKSEALDKLKWNAKIQYGFLSDLENAEEVSPLKDYAIQFLSIWNKKVASKGEFLWQILCPNSHIIGFIFYTHERNKPVPTLNTNPKEWKTVLEQLSDQSLVQKSKQIYIDGILRIISDNYIVIIKRNEKRLWTKNTALEDAEAILVQAIQKQKESK